MTVIAHHPIIIHLESVLVCLHTVDVDSVFFLFQFIAFISSDTPFINGQIVRGQCDGGTLCRNPDRAVVTTIPMGI